MDVSTFVIGLVIGVVAGLSWARFTGPSKATVVELEDRARSADRRLVDVIAQRDSERETVGILRKAIVSERELLDAVAETSGIDREVFRATVAREYLGRSTGDGLGPTEASGAALDVATEANLRAELAAKDALVAEAWAQIRDIRSQLEALASNAGIRFLPRADADPATLDLRWSEPVIELTSNGHASPDDDERMRHLQMRADAARLLEQEVGVLRERLADLTLANDDLRHRIERRREFDERLGELLDSLASLRAELEAETGAQAGTFVTDPA